MAKVRVPQWGRPDKYYLVNEAAAADVATPAATVNPVAAPLTPPRSSLDNIPDGSIDCKTRCAYVQGGIAFLPRAGLDGLFNPSFELNAITVPGTPCSVVGEQPSDGWSIIQNDVDVNGNPLWSVQATDSTAANGFYSLAFSVNAGAINTSSGLSMVIESLPIANLGETMGIDASFFGATIIGTSTFPFTYFAGLNNYIHGYDPAGGGATDYANAQIDFGHGVLTPLGAWTTFSSQSDGWSATSQYPLYKARIIVRALFGAATVTSGQAAQPVIFIDNIKDAFNVQLASQVSGTLPVANLPTIPGSVASFQSGSVTITPAVGAQVTTNITLGTAVNIAKSLISIDYGSTTAAVASSPTRASLTSTTNLQLITDAQIGGVADSMTLNWQVLTWN